MIMLRQHCSSSQKNNNQGLGRIFKLNKIKGEWERDRMKEGEWETDFMEIVGG